MTVKSKDYGDGHFVSLGGQGFISLNLDAEACKPWPLTAEFDDVAHIVLRYKNALVIIRGGRNQTLPEFLLSLAERAGEPIEFADKGGGP